MSLYRRVIIGWEVPPRMHFDVEYDEEEEERIMTGLDAYGLGIDSWDDKELVGMSLISEDDGCASLDEILKFIKNVKAKKEAIRRICGVTVKGKPKLYWVLD